MRPSDLGVFLNESAAVATSLREMVLPVHMKKGVAAIAAHSLYYARWSNVGDVISPYQADASVLMKASPLILLIRLFLLSEPHLRLVWEKAVVMPTRLNE